MRNDFICFACICVFMATARGRIVTVFHVIFFVLDTCIYGDYKGPYSNGLSCAINCSRYMYLWRLLGAV